MGATKSKRPRPLTYDELLGISVALQLAAIEHRALSRADGDRYDVRARQLDALAGRVDDVRYPLYTRMSEDEKAAQFAKAMPDCLSGASE